MERGNERSVRVCCFLNYNFLLEMEMFARMTTKVDVILQTRVAAAAPATHTTITQWAGGISLTQNMKWK